MSSTLLRSQIECPNCGDIIASISRHDFQACGCGGTMLDGGRDYMRVLGDAIVSAGIEDYDRSLFINGALNNAQAALALRIYKALWRLSHSGQRPVTDQELQNDLGRPPISLQRIQSVLLAFSLDEVSPVERVGRDWLPKVPLAIRFDAP